MSEQPTPITNDHVNELRRNPEVSGCNRTLEFARNLERQLADALAQLRIADEQLALERGALVEAREQRNRLADAFSEWPRLREWLEMEPFIKGYLSVEIPTLDAMSAALAAVKETPNVPAVDLPRLIRLVRRHMDTSDEPECGCEYQHGNCKTMDYRNAYAELRDYLEEIEPNADGDGRREARDIVKH